MKLIKLNPLGIAHYLIPVAVFVLVGIGGGAYLIKSHAATCKDYTYAAGVNGSQCVKDIQQILNNSIPKQVDLVVDGSFGSKTTAAVKTFQSDSPGPITADGVVGPKTWTKLCSAYPVIGSNAPQKAAGC